jgi:hypothetical protein
LNGVFARVELAITSHERAEDLRRKISQQVPDLNFRG